MLCATYYEHHRGSRLNIKHAPRSTCISQRCKSISTAPRRCAGQRQVVRAATATREKEEDMISKHASPGTITPSTKPSITPRCSSSTHTELLDHQSSASKCSGSSYAASHSQFATQWQREPESSSPESLFLGCSLCVEHTIHHS